MTEILANPDAGKHRRSPSGDFLQGTGIPLRMGTSHVLNSGSSSGTITDTEQKVSTNLSAGSPTLVQIDLKKASAEKKYRIQAQVPIMYAHSLASAGGRIEMALAATSTSGGVLDPFAITDARDFPAADATGGAAVSDSTMLEFDAELILDGVNFPGFVEGDDVTFTIDIKCEASLAAATEAYVYSNGSSGPGGQCSLSVTEIG